MCLSTFLNSFYRASVYLALLALCVAAWGLLIAGLCAVLAGCSIEPQVTVEKPVVNVSLCIELSEDGRITLVACDAGEGVSLVDAGILP